MSDQVTHPLSGRLFTEYYVVCGVCQEENPVGAKSYSGALFYLKRGGWRHTKRQGYVCKQCWESRRTKEE